MKNLTFARHLGRQTLVTLVSASLALGPMTQPAYAALTALADVPIAAKVAAKPNIVYTVDDSGSMNSNFIPDFVTDSAYPAYCRGGINLNGALAPYYGTVGGFNNAMTACDPGSITAFNFPAFYAGDFNHLAYNPNVTYTPPLKADGTPLTNNIGTVTDAQGNQINLKKVQVDPYNSPATTADLSVSVTVPIYCNSDWPLIGAQPYDNKSDVMSLVLGDIGDVVGEDPTLNSGFGQHCRINGTPYAAAATSGAPAIKDDYNYPWPKVGATAGAAGSANDRAYFWRSSGVRQLWCNQAAAGWPETCSKTDTYKCPNGGKPISPPPAPQTCYLQSVSTVCAAWTTTYSPDPTAIGKPCNQDPAYDLGGCVGAECQKCTATTVCSATTDQSNGACHLTANGGPPGSGGDGAGCYCWGTGCKLPACADFQAAPTTCSKGGSPVPQQTCAKSGAWCQYAPYGLVWDNVNQVSTSTSLLDDSNLTNGGTGAVCRHNNFDYKDGKGAYPDTYPSGLFTTPVNGYCPQMTTTATIPRHYYTVDSVQFCDTPNSTANAQWNGFGTGVCQSKNDFTKYKYVKYGQFHRIDLVNDGRTFPYVDITGTAGVRSYAQEVINYANWYAYYRTRILAAKTTSSIAFSYLDDTYRVGFHDLGTSSPTPVLWVDVNDFNLAQKTLWYNKLFGLNASYSTFTMSAMLRIGNLFETGGAAGLPANVNPLPGTAKDPITLSCQNNYHILITDGFTNEPTLPLVVGERDATVPSFAATPDIPPDNVLPNLRPLFGSPWPKPFAQDPAWPVANTLADIATKYWATDLRPGLKNDVPSSSGKGTGDLDWTKDVAWWQHVSFSAISFGSEGVLDASQRKSTLAAIKAGTLTWGNLANPNSPTQPPGAGKGTAGVDDLWHATVNSRGQFVYAKSPIEVSYGLASILAGIANQRKSRVGASFSGQVLDATNNIIYESTIEPGWAGDLLKVQIDPTTAAEVATLWQASTVLGQQVAQYISAAATPTVPASNGLEPWFTNRRIVTINDSTGKAVPFTYGKLSAAQLGTLAPTPTLQQEVIAYLRGGSSFNTGIVNPSPPPATIYKPIEGTGIGQFRQRFGALGDITNGQPVIVTAPAAPFSDVTDPGYSAFVAGHSARPTRIYAPANDGMLHSFDEADGHEVFAYVPKALIRSDVDASGKPTGIQALTFQDGGVPIYKHHFYVDSTPRTSDVDFSGGAGTDWRTIVVGGLGKGGNSYYALDITDASAVDEAAAASKVLWEYHDGDWNYTYGRPVIVKTRAFGWTVIVTSGYNNVSGEGRVYFLDPKTGQPFAAKPYMSTGFGSAGNPSGLAQISGFTKDFHNQIVEQIYGGDLYGNLWRFEVSDPNPANWTVVQFAKLTDSGGTAQPITTAPQIEIDFANGIDRYVFIGTGQLLDPSDLTTPTPAQEQTLYAIRDGTLSVPMTAGLPVIPRVTLKPTNADGVSAIVGGAPNGWYQDLPTGANAERIVVDVEADVNTVAYVGTQIQNDPCIIALPATLYAREYASGRSLLDSGGGAPLASVVIAAGGVGFQVVGMVDATGQITLGGLVSTEIPGTQPVQFLNPLIGGAHRFSWRLLGGE